MHFFQLRGAARRRQRPGRGVARCRKLTIELLEQRQLLTTGSDWYNTPSPDWFQTVPSPAVMEDGTTAPASRWIVRLDADFALTLGAASQSWQAFYPQTVLGTDQTAPWLEFSAITGLGLPGQILVEANAPDSQVEADLARLPHVSSFERQAMIGGSQLPNDPRFIDQVALNNTGQTGGTPGADINAPKAWDLQTGSKSVVVAVIDSGVDYTHQDLAANIWTNPGEIPGNGIDDDHNGFIDDVHGYDFVNNDGDPMDDNGHGTQVAGIIGAVGNNTAPTGVAGVAWSTSIMALKFLDRNLQGTSDDAIRAFNYMTMMKTGIVSTSPLKTISPVNILVSNNSWGLTGGLDLGLKQAVASASNAGILVVAAAGNGNAQNIGINNDETPFYPASFSDPRIISVASSDKNDKLSTSSNFGRTSVDIAAPGESILSTSPGNNYGSNSGTSFAAPFVTGTAALVYSQHPGATPDEVKSAILTGAKKIPDFGPRLSSGGRLDAYGALTAQTFAPKATMDPVQDISAATSALAVTIHYEDDVNGIDPDSITSTNIAVQRVGFSNTVATVSVDPNSDIVASFENHRLDVTYYITPTGGTFDATMAGTYNVVLQNNQVVSGIGLAASAATLGSFQVTLTDPHVFIVNTTVDSPDSNPGDGVALDKETSPRTSLRAAIMEANHHAGAYTIVLPDGAYSLSIPEPSVSTDFDGSQGDLDILSNITLLGAGVTSTVIDAQKKNRAFELVTVSNHPSGTPKTAPSLTLRSLAIENGKADAAGGAILVDTDAGDKTGSSLTLDHCLLKSNTAGERGGAIASLNAIDAVSIQASTLDGNSTLGTFGTDFGGGAVFNRGVLTISSSTISNNVANGGLNKSGGGGGILHVGPGVFTVTNSTISGNTAALAVGGGLSLLGPTTLDYDTITNNNVPKGTGGGIYSISDIVSVSDTIIAGNHGGPDSPTIFTQQNSYPQDPDVGGTVYDGGTNLIGIVGDAVGFGVTSLAVLLGDYQHPLDPGLGPLQDNGGPTFTHELLANSKAIDGAIYFNRVQVDQRGNPRPVLRYGIFGFQYDIGAVEKSGQTIRGTMFVDVNHNGIREPDEPGVAGQTVFVDRNENGRLDPGEPSAVTSADDPLTPGVDESGEYALRNVAGGPALIADVVGSGITSAIPNAIARNPTITFHKLVDTATLHPGSATTKFSGFGPPVIGDGTVLFPEAGASGGLYAAQWNQATLSAQLSTIATPGESIPGGVTLHSINQYDFDGKLIALTAGNATVDQVALAQLDGTIVPVTNYAGTPTGELSVGNGIAAFRTLSPDSVYVTAINPDQPLAATTALAARADGTTITQLNKPRVDAVTSDVVLDSDLPGGTSTLQRFNSGLGLQPLLLSYTTGTERILDADGGDEIVSTTASGVETITRVTNAGPLIVKTVLVDTNTAVPQGTGNFTGLFSGGSTRANASMSNRAVAFGGTDAAGRYGIYLVEDDGSISKVIAVGDSREGKTVSSLQLAGVSAGGNKLDQNKLAFLAQFADGSQAIYEADLTPVPGYRMLVKDGLGDAQINFPTTVAPAEIHGVVFNDLNRNGFKDDNEPTLAGWTVFIDANHNGVLDSGEKNVATDGTGSYFFDQLDPLQAYTVSLNPQQLAPPSHYLQTAPTANGGQAVVILSPGQIATGINFGLASSLPGSGAGSGSKMSGQVQLLANNGKDQVPSATAATLLKGVTPYIDLNGDGKLEPFDAKGNVLEPSATLDDQGNYSISGVPDSNVQLRLQTPPGMAQASPLISNRFTEPNPLYSLPEVPAGVAAADFHEDNGTGHDPADLAVTMIKSDEIWILRNSGSGVFSTSTPSEKISVLGKNPGDIAAADVNGDGWPDLIVSNQGDSSISIFINQKNASQPFSTTAKPLTYAIRSNSNDYGRPRGIVIGDFDGKGLPDIAVVDQYGQANGNTSGDVAVFVNDTQPGKAASFHLVSAVSLVGIQPVALVAGHFTGGANLDLAVANRGLGNDAATSSVSILQGDGKGGFTAFKTIAVGVGPTSIAAGTLFGDKDTNNKPLTDLVTSDYDVGTVTILRGQAGGAFVRQDVPGGTGPSSVVLADVDADGDLDIALSNGSDSTDKNHVLVLRNQGGAFSAPEPATGSATFYPDAAFSLVAAELDAKPGIDLALVIPTKNSGASYEAGQLDVLTNHLNSDSVLHVALETPNEIDVQPFQVGFPWHNLVRSLDVDNDGIVAPKDIVAIIRYLNGYGASSVPGLGAVVGGSKVDFGQPFGYVDTDGDGSVAPKDIVKLITYLNAFGAGEGESIVPLAQTASPAPAAGPAELALQSLAASESRPPVTDPQPPPVVFLLVPTVQPNGHEESLLQGPAKHIADDAQLKLPQSPQDGVDGIDAVLARWTDAVS